eukprot:SAG22_NODE_3037_length_2005_cov_1.538825_1_plen_228_part_00
MHGCLRHNQFEWKHEGRQCLTTALVMGDTVSLLQRSLLKQQNSIGIERGSQQLTWCGARVSNNPARSSSKSRSAIYDRADRAARRGAKTGRQAAQHAEGTSVELAGWSGMSAVVRERKRLWRLCLLTCHAASAGKPRSWKSGASSISQNTLESMPPSRNTMSHAVEAAGGSFGLLRRRLQAVAAAEAEVWLSFGRRPCCRPRCCCCSGGSGGGGGGAAAAAASCIRG